MKYLIFIVLILIALAGYWTLGPSKGNGEQIIVGTNTEYPPYSYIEKGEIIGFDIDIAKAVCLKLGKEMVLVDMPFDALLPQLQMKQIDFIAAGLTRTEERAKKVLFTTPYFSGDPLVIVALQPISVEQLPSVTVVVNEGFNADLYASSIEGLEILRLSAAADALLALKSGRAGAFIAAYSTVKHLGDNFWISKPLEGGADDVTIAISKQNLELLLKVESVLNQLKADGTIEQLKTKWGLL